MTQIDFTNACSMWHINQCPNQLDARYALSIITDYETMKSFNRYFCSETCMGQYDKKQICGMQRIDECPKKINGRSHFVQTTGYYRNRGISNYFCSEECAKTFSKYHKCNECSYTDGKLITSKKDGYVYCSDRGYDDQSCYEKHMGLSGETDKINKIVDRFITTIWNTNDKFSSDELIQLKERICEILDEKNTNEEKNEAI
jgi:YHS domain-containing protein